MSLHRITRAVATGLFIVTSSSLFGASPGEEITLNPATGNYDITYCGIGFAGAKSTCILRHVVFEPATKITPILKSSFVPGAAGTIAYRYSVENGKRARQLLVTFVLEPVRDIQSPQSLPKRAGDISSGQLADALAAGAAAVSTPKGWYGTEARGTDGLRVAWMDNHIQDGMKGLGAGRRQRGFGFTSGDLPGIIAAQFTGNPTQRLAFPDEGPDGDIAARLGDLQVDDFVTAYAAVPSIPVPAPFDRAELLRRIGAQVKTWVGLKLLDPVVFSRIDGLIQAAVAAAAINDGRSCEADIDNVERQIHQMYESLDDTQDQDDSDEKPDSPPMSRLAARVLEFDLMYALHHL